MPARSPLTGRFIFVLQGSKGPTKKKWQWTTQRRIMLLTQVSTTGVNAFLTSRDVPGQSQVEVWTNESTEILPVLFKSHTGEFEPGPNEEHPTHISTIAAMKKWLKVCAAKLARSLCVGTFMCCIARELCG